MTQRDQCHWKKNLLLTFLKRRRNAMQDHRESTKFWSGGKSRENLGHSLHCAFGGKGRAG